MNRGAEVLLRSAHQLNFWALIYSGAADGIGVWGQEDGYRSVRRQGGGNCMRMPVAGRMDAEPEKREGD